MLCLMHDAEPYGHLCAGSKVINEATLARMIGCKERELRKYLAELEQASVFSRTPAGVIYSRRMLKDVELSETRSASGAMGGNRALGADYNVPGYVYLMSRADGKHKIGISAHPEKRAYKLRVKLSDESVSVVTKVFVSNMGRAEAIMHKKYEAYKGVGEWFCLPPEEVAQLVRLMENGDFPLKANQEIPLKQTVAIAIAIADGDSSSGEGMQGEGGHATTIPPPIEWVIAYGARIMLPEAECRAFFDHHDARGWLSKGSRIYNWQKAMTAWFKNYRSGAFEGKGAVNGKPKHPTTEEYAAAMHAANKTHDNAAEIIERDRKTRDARYRRPESDPGAADAG